MFQNDVKYSHIIRNIRKFSTIIFLNVHIFLLMIKNVQMHKYVNRFAGLFTDNQTYPRKFENVHRCKIHSRMFISIH